MIRLTTCGSCCELDENRLLFFGGWFDNFNSITERTFTIELTKNDKTFIRDHNKFILPSRGGHWYPQTIVHNNLIYIFQNIESVNSDGCFLNKQQRVMTFNGRDFEIRLVNGQFQDMNIIFENHMAEFQQELIQLEQELGAQHPLTMQFHGLLQAQNNQFEMSDDQYNQEK